MWLQSSVRAFILIMRIKSAISYLVAPLMLASSSPAALPSAALAARIRGLLVLIGLGLGLATVGCTSRTATIEAPRAPSAADDAADTASVASIAAVHRRKCGNCHTRVEPGLLPRATIEAAMVRHRRRAKLTNDQWAELIEFLSRGGTAEPRHTASLP